MRGPCLETSGGGEKWELKTNWNGGASMWGEGRRVGFREKKEGRGAAEMRGLMEREKVLIEKRGPTEVG